MTPQNLPEPPGDTGTGTDDQHWLDLMAGRSAPGAHPGTREQAVRLRAALLRDRAAAPAGAPAAADERAVRLLQRARAAGVLPAEAAADVPDVPDAPHAPDAPDAANAADVGNASNVRHTGRAGDGGGGDEGADGGDGKHGHAGRPALPAVPANARQARGRAANHWRYAAAACVAAGAALLAWPPGRVADDGTGSATLRGAAQQRVEAADPLSRRQQLLAALRDAGFDAEPFDRLGRPGIDVALPVPLSPVQAAALRRLGLQPPAGPGLQVEVVAPAQPPAR